jgi:Replication initiator protein, pSAM2
MARTTAARSARCSDRVLPVHCRDTVRPPGLYRRQPADPGSARRAVHRPHQGVLLPTWDEALDDIGADPAATPAHVLQLGDQLDYQASSTTRRRQARPGGQGHRLSDQVPGQGHQRDLGNPDHLTGPQLRHMATLHHHVRWLPCSPECCNWLRFGVQPKDAVAGMVPGECPGKAHDRHHLGIGGRRVLGSCSASRPPRSSASGATRRASATALPHGSERASATSRMCPKSRASRFGYTRRSCTTLSTASTTTCS